MTLGGLGARERRGSSFPIVPIFSGLLLIVGLGLFGREMVTYSSRNSNLQRDVQIGAIQVGGLSESQAQARLEEVYLEQPIKLEYRDSPILLNPASAGLRLNTEAMFAQVRTQGNSRDSFWAGFWRYLWGEEATPIAVPLSATVEEPELRAVLEDISLRYDSLPGGAGFDSATLTFRDGNEGALLDIDASVELIRAAMLNPDPEGRVITLPTQQVEAEAANMNDLRQAILDYMALNAFLPDGNTTIGSVFVMNLRTGEEMSIYGDVQHSAVSTIKVGIIINYFRYQVAAPDADSAFLLAAAIICSNNSAANFLVQITGGGGSPMVAGLQAASQTMLDIGAINSWLTSPLYVGEDGSYPVIEPPARTNTPNQSLNAQPDPYNRTTAEDMGTMLMMMYDCAEYGGGLRAIYPDDITQTECQQMLEILSGTRFSRFSELGAPLGTRIAHKVGYGAETVGDVAVVYSPNADYVFVMYIWEEDTNNNFLTELDKWTLIDNTSRIVYNYFNPDQPLSETRPPDNPLGGAACVLPLTAAEINLSNINENRFDANGNPVSTACYDYPACRPFDNWGRDQ